ncbi:MAG: hypothetical protein JXR25_09745 [Pontiellaceae bacterium]|nr:hypothetical protein [Pontiellaceae bacterium]MBN2785100.1 hypothetical protein [Pontiellaceae bacterium]
MKKAILKLLIETTLLLGIYRVLLGILAGTNIVAGVFCPGSHLPGYYPALIFFFLLLRLYLVLLPAILLARLVKAWLRHRCARTELQQI